MVYSSGLLLSLSLLLGLGEARPLKRDDHTTTANDIIIQLFQWSWDSIAYECGEFIGPAGYGYVQVSPAEEHIAGPQWWTDYQPVSYTIDSKRGNRTAYANMISACHAAGVGVIADTIWNHMAGVSGGIGVDGTSFTKYNYTDTYQYQDFHHNCGEPNGEIENYNNRTEVQFCELVGLADLATETEYVRGRLAEYGNDLISLGVDGLRLDASKHIPSTDIANIVSRLTESLYITQEVIWGSGEPIQPNEYQDIGDVQEFRYTSALQTAFSNDNLNGLYTINTNPAGWGWVPDGYVNVFVSNHDTERNGNSINYQWANNAYTLAHVYMLAYPYGVPTVLSSYEFSTSNTDAGAPNNNTGTCYGAGGVNGWLCQHRWTAIAGMVGFHNQVAGTSINNWTSPQQARIAWGRGSSGFVAINYVDANWSTTFTTALPDGLYCDVVHGAKSGNGCTASTIVVSNGQFTASIGNRDAVAIHIGAKLSPSSHTDKTDALIPQYPK